MVNSFFLISNFYHSDVNRNLPRRRPIFAARRCPIFAAEFPPPRCHSRERGNPFLPTNSRLPAVFFVEKRGEFAVLFLKMDSRFRGNDGGFFFFSGGIAGDFLRRIPPFFPNSARRRCPILAAEFPPPRRHSRERGNPFSPTNPRVHAVFCEKMRGNFKLNFRVKFAKFQN